MPNEYYSKAFYARVRRAATRSAEVIAPLVLELLPVRSVVDIGCGDGSWLAVFQTLGVLEILGVDGDYVDQSLLRIPSGRFQPADLTKPFSLGRVFDLAVSLEVGEHLPADSAAPFVESLTRAAPVVLFSAAIPFQGGDHHVSEQWPDEWASLFQKQGYLTVDCIRRRVWQNESVDWWYAQNTLLFARAGVVASNAGLKAAFEQTNSCQLRLVHPGKYLQLVDDLRSQPPSPPSGVKATLQFLLASVKQGVTRRIRSTIGKVARP